MFQTQSQRRPTLSSSPVPVSWYKPHQLLPALRQIHTVLTQSFGTTGMSSECNSDPLISNMGKSFLSSLSLGKGAQKVKVRKVEERPATLKAPMPIKIRNEDGIARNLGDYVSPSSSSSDCGVEHELMGPCYEPSFVPDYFSAGYQDRRKREDGESAAGGKVITPEPGNLETLIETPFRIPTPPHALSLSSKLDTSISSLSSLSKSWVDAESILHREQFAEYEKTHGCSFPGTVQQFRSICREQAAVEKKVRYKTLMQVQRGTPTPGRGGNCIGGPLGIWGMESNNPYEREESVDGDEGRRGSWCVVEEV